MRRVVVLVLLVLLAEGAARGKDDPAKPAGPSIPVADVLEAWRAKDAEKLAALAARQEPDPWLVADELRVEGEAEAAKAFAQAVGGAEAGRLTSYVSARAGVEPDRALRARWAAVEAALAAGDTAGAVQAAGPSKEPLDSVAAVRLAYRRGVALATLGRKEAAGDVLRSAGEGAEKLGWLAEAVRAYEEAGFTAYDRQDWAKALEAWEATVRVAEARGDERAQAIDLMNVANVHRLRGEYDEAQKALEKALPLAEHLGDPPQLAQVLQNLGGVLVLRGKYEEALKNDAGIARAMRNVGVVQTKMGALQDALASQQGALAILQRLGDKAGVATTLGDVGLVYEALSDYPRALDAHRRALGMLQDLGAKAGLARELANIGTIQVLTADYLGERTRRSRRPLGLRDGGREDRGG